VTDDQTPKQPEETQDGGISRRKLVGTGIAAVGATVIWGSPVPFSRKGIGASIDTAWAQGQEEISPNHGHKQNFSEAPPNTGNPAKVGYCSVAGNTLPDGTKLPPNTFIPLNPGQPDYDDHYTGAVPANYIEGVGITCDAPPAGFVRMGFADNDMVPKDTYPYYGPAK
jgi:hypothetical protein